MVVHTVLLFAQMAAGDPISGGAGWIGAGLLGAVLAWLMFVHLPAKDKILRDIQAEHLAYSQRLLDRHDRAVGEQQAVFSEAIRRVTEHCSAELEKITTRFTAGIQDILARLDGEPGHDAGRRKGSDA